MRGAFRVCAGRAGITLIELAVTLAIVGIAAAVTGLAIRAMPAPGAAETRAAEVAAARRRALREGRAVEIELADSSGAPLRGVALPDGRVLADPALQVDLFSGRPGEAPR